MNIRIPWWAWYYVPLALGILIVAVVLFMLIQWYDAAVDERYRVYITKYQCVETAIETPPGHTYFRYTCNNGYQFTLGRKP